jgi:hypothetical protein
MTAVGWRGSQLHCCLSVRLSGQMIAHLINLETELHFRGVTMELTERWWAPTFA